LLKDPASFNPTTVALSFLSNEIKDRLERVCSEDTYDVFDEFCKIAVSERHRPDHEVIRHLLERVVTSNQPRTRQVSREERVREWLMPILKPYEFNTLLEPLCHLLDLYPSEKEEKKRTLRMFVLKLVSWAIYQSGDDSFTTIWKDIERAVEDLIKEYSDYRSHRSMLRPDLNLHMISNDDKRRDIEKCLKEWIDLNPFQDISRLINPLISAYEELLLPDETTASSSAASEKGKIKVELIIDALRALGPGDLSDQTKLIQLLGRVLRFVSYWDKTIEKLACSWLDFAEESSRDTLHPLLELIANTCKEPGPLYGIIDALPKSNESVDDTLFEIAKQICPGVSFVALQTCVTLLNCKDLEIDDKRKAAAEEICSSEGKEALSMINRFMQAKNAVINLKDEEVSSMTELMALRDIMDIVCKIAGWTVSKKKSVSALSILFSYRAYNLMKNSSPEAYCMAKIGLLVSVMDFYQGKHWEQKEAIKKDGLYCLEWEKADISAIAAECFAITEDHPASTRQSGAWESKRHYQLDR